MHIGTIIAILIGTYMNYVNSLLQTIIQKRLT